MSVLSVQNAVPRLRKAYRGAGPSFISTCERKMPATAKQRALEAIQQLPEDASFEEVMERLYFLSKVERGIEQANAGQTVSHEEAKQRLGR